MLQNATFLVVFQTLRMSLSNIPYLKDLEFLLLRYFLGLDRKILHQSIAFHKCSILDPKSNPCLELC